SWQTLELRSTSRCPAGPSSRVARRWCRAIAGNWGILHFYLKVLLLLSAFCAFLTSGRFRISGSKRSCRGNSEDRDDRQANAFAHRSPDNTLTRIGNQLYPGARRASRLARVPSGVPPTDAASIPRGERAAGAVVGGAEKARRRHQNRIGRGGRQSLHHDVAARF